MIFYRPLKIHCVRHLWISLCSISVLCSNGNLRSNSKSKVEWRLVLCQSTLSNSNTNVGMAGKAFAETAEIYNQWPGLLSIMWASPTQTPERPECITDISLGKNFCHPLRTLLWPLSLQPACPAQGLRRGEPSQTPQWHNHTASSLKRNLFLSVV